MPGPRRHASLSPKGTRKVCGIFGPVNPPIVEETPVPQWFFASTACLLFKIVLSGAAHSNNENFKAGCIAGEK
jgi:hypothetical protein